MLWTGQFSVAATAVVTLLSLTANTQSQVTAYDFFLEIKGPISPDTARNVERLAGIPRRVDHGKLMVEIESRGGDVDAAMSIGRHLRKLNARISTCRCASACVLILAAGVERRPSGYCNSRIEPEIGVHRLYESYVDSKEQIEITRQRRRAKLQEVRAYLDEMGIPSTLMDLMESIPPDAMRNLSAAELKTYHLEGDDPAWDEHVVAQRASAIGITSAEYRRRKVLSDDLCRDEERAKDRALGSGWDRYSKLQFAHIVCTTSVMMQVPRGVVARSLESAIEICKGLTAPASGNCFRAVFERASNR